MPDATTIEIIGGLLGASGAILVALTALRVHHRVWKEHKIDKQVFAEMKRERIIGHVGVTAMILGLLLELLALTVL